MELNGISNLYCLLQMALSDGKIDQQVHDDMNDQLDILERYLIALDRTMDQTAQMVPAAKVSSLPKVPYWHEVRDNRTNYPLRSFSRTWGYK